MKQDFDCMSDLYALHITRFIIIIHYYSLLLLIIINYY